MKYRLLIGYVLVLLSFCIPTDLKKPSEDGFIQVKPLVTTQKVEAKSFEVQASLAQVVVEQPKPVVQTIVNCGDSIYKQYIYQHESGCRLNAVNPIGACGLGQALPCSKLSNVCPNWQTDFACQDQFFTQYASRYGGWAGAYAAWQSKSWW